MQKTAAFYTLGCKLNFAETSTIARNLKNGGYDTVDFKQNADVYVINTCSVTQNADNECKRIVTKARKANPDGLVIIVGCYAQLKPEEIAQIPGVDLVLGAREKFNIIQFIDTLQKSEETQIHSCEIHEADIYESAYSIGDRTRAFLKVQDGCDYKCTYCTIPLARGISRSDTIDNILEKAHEIEAQGIKEIVLTGVNIGDYGKGEFGNKKHEHTFMELCQRLDEETNVHRLRISSIEPNLLKNELIEFTASSQRFVPHFHIPLQSGSDVLLKKMKRRYLTGLYTERVNKIREVMPHAAIGVDVITGFPGETDEEFLNTYNYLNGLDISYLHVFTYSERDNTEAIDFEGVVPLHVRKKRNKMLNILSEKKRMAFYQSQLGTTRKVVWEEENRNGIMYGYTENYIRVQTPYDPALINQLMDIELVMINAEGIVEVQMLQPA